MNFVMHSPDPECYEEDDESFHAKFEMPKNGKTITPTYNIEDYKEVTVDITSTEKISFTLSWKERHREYEHYTSRTLQRRGENLYSFHRQFEFRSKEVAVFFEIDNLSSTNSTQVEIIIRGDNEKK